MDIRKIMILVIRKGKVEDQTEEIQSISAGQDNKKIIVEYRGGRSYPFNKCNITVLKNPNHIILNGQAAYIDGIPVYKPILDFGKWIRVIFNDKSKSVAAERFSLIDNASNNQDVSQVIDYLRDISQHTSNKPEDEAFLGKEMAQLTFVHPNSVLSCYLHKHPPLRRTLKTEEVIFPFLFNLSQKAALQNALESSISVLEGPPGTGKTQTILNILANLVAVQSKSVAVVSNNNEAVRNVIEKLEKQNYSFLTALLGRDSNQKAFFANMPVANVDKWDCEESQEELINHIKELNKNLNRLLYTDRERAKCLQELRAWQLEQKHFENYFTRQDVQEISRLPLMHATPDRIISFLTETSHAKQQNEMDKLIYKLKLLFKYGVLNHKKLMENEVAVLLSLQREFYRKQIEDLEQEISKFDIKLEEAEFSVLQEAHQKYSEKLFRKYLYRSHNGLDKPDFTRKNFKVKFKDFIKTYPIILSSTHSLRKSIPENYLLDYVIIDESSMVDLITGALSFSCCKNVIIVGDTHQLPQIINEKIEAKLKTSAPDSVFNYFVHNILSSVIDLYKDKLPSVILKEHYRCHPQIIEFCNQKYYDGKLIPFTRSDASDLPLILYLTSEGNHMRRVTHGEKQGRYNQREIDVTVEEILKNPIITKNNNNIGFVTPFRKQADKATQFLEEDIESDTVHKYQGREKDAIIMYTVLDNTRDGKIGLKFVDDSQLINVAVSRAINHFVLVTDKDLFFKKGEHIGDLIRYIEYSTLDENVVESEIVSVFDLLYKKYSSKLLPLKAKMSNSARFESEEALRVMLEEIIMEPYYNRYSYSYSMLLRNLLSDISLLTPEELAFVNNRASLDFVIFNKHDKVCSLVIEVDGFAFHENNPVQLRRDELKDSILDKYKIPILRLASNGSRERERVQSFLA